MKCLCLYDIVFYSFQHRDSETQRKNMSESCRGIIEIKPLYLCVSVLVLIRYHV